MNRTVRLTLGFLAVGSVAAAVTALSLHLSAPPPPALVATPPPAFPVNQRPPVEFLAITRGDTFADLLGQAGVDRNTGAQMVAAVSKVFDVRRFRAGAILTLTRSDSGAVDSLEYIIDPDHKLSLSTAGGGYTAAVLEIPGVIRAVPVCTALRGSLFESLESVGETAELTLRMAAIFAWDIDFYTDPQEGDEFCVLVEKKIYDNGQQPTYRRILAARYNNAGKLFDGFLFPDEDGKPAYFSRDGRSLRSAFLRSPMKFEARVSSHFTHRRFHPVLKIYRPHLGTDYAAPTGTPVQAVASGVVLDSSYGRGEGNWIRIRHSNGFESQYLHLSRRFVRAGEKVEQGERIGLVGSTGLATGPHLDFRIRKNGRYVNFEKLDVPRTTEVPAARKTEFAAARDRFVAQMDARVPVEPAIVAAAGRKDQTEP